MVAVLELAAGHGLDIGIRAAEQVLGKLGQLPGAEERFAVDHEGRQNFLVAVPGGVHVEHEADQSPLHPCACAHVDRKARAAQLARPLHVQDAQRLAIPSEAWARNRRQAFSPQVLTTMLSASICRWGLRPWSSWECAPANRRNKRGGGGGQLVQLVLEGAGLVHQRRGVLAELFERAPPVDSAHCAAPCTARPR